MRIFPRRPTKQTKQTNKTRKKAPQPKDKHPQTATIMTSGGDFNPPMQKAKNMQKLIKKLTSEFRKGITRTKVEI